MAELLTFDTLVRFHREVFMPDFEQIVETHLTGVHGRIDGLRNEMLSGFDAIYKRLDRLETECHALSAAVKRLEERVTAVEQKLDRMALRSELLELKAQVVSLEERIAQLESEIEPTG